MERGDIYLAAPLGRDPRKRRPFVVVSRKELIQSSYSSILCVPIYSSANGLETEVLLGPSAGIKHVSFARCDEITSVDRRSLTRFAGRVPVEEMRRIHRALLVALDIPPQDVVQ